MCNCQLPYEIATAAFYSNIFLLWAESKSFSTQPLFCMRGDKKKRYFGRMYFIFDKKQLDLLSSITGDFV